MGLMWFHYWPCSLSLCLSPSLSLSVVPLPLLMLSVTTQLTIKPSSQLFNHEKYDMLQMFAACHGRLSTTSSVTLWGFICFTYRHLVSCVFMLYVSLRAPIENKFHAIVLSFDSGVELSLIITHHVQPLWCNIVVKYELTSAYLSVRCWFVFCLSVLLPHMDCCHLIAAMPAIWNSRLIGMDVTLWIT